MRSLVDERTCLGHTCLIFGAADIILALSGGDGRVGVGIVGFDAEVTDIFHHVNLEAIVFGVAEVVGHVVGIGAAANLAVG